MLPPRISEALELGLQRRVRQAVSVSGGDINQAARVTLDNAETIFVKWHNQPPAGMFAAEATGLTLLHQAHALLTPTPLLQTDHLLALSWLPSQHAEQGVAARQLGNGLARQHRFTADRFGLDHNNYCGLTPQINTRTTNWPKFFGRYRLGTQMTLAAERGRLPAQRRKQLTRLINHLPNLLPATPPASLLHGDLWGGNWLITTAGAPALIDPAVYFGHREADLAFTELFGGFPPEFYHAYQAEWPLEPGYQDRRELYNLYHLLNHLNLFGESYGRSVDSILQRYIG